VNQRLANLVSLRGSTKLAIVILLLVALFWPGIQNHWQMAQDPYFVPFDAVQYIPPFFKFAPKDPIPTTYVKEYYLNAVCPLLYKGLTIIGAQLGDVRHFQLGMMYLVYAVFIGVLGRIGWVLGGAALSFAVVALTVTAWIFIGLGFIGGAPRMYAYPLISLVLLSLVQDRPYLLAVTAVLGGLLYPVVAMIAGICLASWMLLSPLSTRGEVLHWSLSRRLTLLALTGFLSIAGLIPLMHGSSPYGRQVVETDIATYPELGPEGGYRSYDKLPYKIFGHESIAYFIGPTYSHGDPIAPWLNVHKNFNPMTLLLALTVTGLTIIFVILRGIRLVLKEDPSGAAIRLISFFFLCAVLHVIAWLLAPYLFIPTRYLMFSLPFILTVLFPWSLHALLKGLTQLKSARSFRDIVFIGIICLYLMAFGGRGNVDLSGFSVEKRSQPLFDAVAALPNDVLIAGWPLGETRKMEYVTRRNVFVTLDTHQLFYLEFVKAMHDRVDALFDAYLSTDAAPLYRLRKEFGVTHLLLETRHLTEPSHAPEYFAPWSGRIQPRLAEIKGKEYLLNESLHKQAGIFNRDGLILLDLAKLP
jgi:hypothetical protein